MMLLDSVGPWNPYLDVAIIPADLNPNMDT